MNNSFARFAIGLIIALTAVIGQAQASKPLFKPTARAYLVANYVVHDPAQFQQYLDATNQLAPNYSANVIVFDTRTQKLEGAAQDVPVIAEFPSLAEAERFYFSAEYTEVRQLRIASTEGTVFLAEGLVLPETRGKGRHRGR